MSVDRRQIERWIGAVLVPEVRVAGTIASVDEVVPSREYLERFPPAGVVAFGRTPRGAVSPTKLIERVRATCRELGNPEPFVACDLEQGAGLHFAEGTRLPPALALASAALDTTELHEPLDPSDPWRITSAGADVGCEARSLGVELVLAPVADVNTQRNNPVIAVRSFGDDPGTVAVRASEFARGLQAGGAAACAKHFPGHGDTTQDSHIELPRIDRDEAALRACELIPFRALIENEVETVMVAHLDVPALTLAPGVPCTLSHRAIEVVLRGELGFRGVVLTDAMNMGALAGHEPRYVRALQAGCDGLLCPHDLDAATRELSRAVEAGRLDVKHLMQAATRMGELRDRLRSTRTRPFDLEQIRLSTQDLALRALRCSKEERPWYVGATCAVLDAFPPAESPETLAGIERLRAALGNTREHPSRTLLPVVCEAGAWRGRYGLSSAELAELEARIASELSHGHDLVIAWFGSPQTLPEHVWLDRSVHVVLAFAPTPPMFAAVERFLAGGVIGRGCLPTKLG